MKKIALCLTTILILNVAHSQDKGEKTNQINYFGNYGVFKNDNPELHKDILSIEFKKYKGSPIFEDLDDESKSKLLEETEKVIYNEFGTVEEYYSDSYFIKSSYKFTYNEKGEAISLIKNQGRFDEKETFKNNKEKNEVTRYVYGYNDVEVDKIIIYKFNEKGLLLNQKEYSGNGILQQEDSFKYDSKGNEIFSNYYGVKTTTTYKFDDKGRIISKRSTNNYGKGFTYTFKYNENGKIIELIDKADSEGIRNKTTYEYENDLLVLEKTIDYSSISKEFNRTEITEYVYDDRGMWIKEIVTRNDILVSISYRNISYKNQ